MKLSDFSKQPEAIYQQNACGMTRIQFLLKSIGALDASGMPTKDANSRLQVILAKTAAESDLENINKIYKGLTVMIQIVDTREVLESIVFKAAITFDDIKEYAEENIVEPLSLDPLYENHLVESVCSGSWYDKGVLVTCVRLPETACAAFTESSAFGVVYDAESLASFSEVVSKFSGIPAKDVFMALVSQDFNKLGKNIALIVTDDSEGDATPATFLGEAIIRRESNYYTEVKGFGEVLVRYIPVSQLKKEIELTHNFLKRGKDK